MNPFEMVVAVVSIGCLTGIVTHGLDVVKAYLLQKTSARRSDPALTETLGQLRDEIAQLRRATNDGVLSFDSTLQRLDTRLQHVERVALGTGAPPASLPSAAPRAPAQTAAREERVAATS